MCCSANNKLPGHNDVLEAMAKCLRRIGISTSRTTVLVHARRSDRNGNPDPTDQSKKQPDLAIYDTHSGGSLPTLLDLVITYPTAPSYLQPRRQTSSRLGAAANQREQAKRTMYRDQAARNGFRFKAFGIEKYGAWGREAESMLEEWAMHAAAANRVDTRATHGWSAQRWTDAMRQEVSVALQLANARLLTNAMKRRAQPQLLMRMQDASVRGDGIEDGDCYGPQEVDDRATPPPEGYTQAPRPVRSVPSTDGAPRVQQPDHSHQPSPAPPSRPHHQRDARQRVPEPHETRGAVTPWVGAGRPLRPDVGEPRGGGLLLGDAATDS